MKFFFDWSTWELCGGVNLGSQWFVNIGLGPFSRWK
jgi:hypothetical protein